MSGKDKKRVVEVNEQCCLWKINEKDFETELM